MAAKQKKERHAQIPMRVLVSDAYKTLGYYERAVLTALCAEFTGYNNGKIALTPVQAEQKYGILGRRRCYVAVSELEKRGLVRCTYRAARLKQYDENWSPNRYALTFRPTDEFPEFKVRRETEPRDSFDSWRPEKNKAPGPPEDTA
jgi:hypothetical protein